MAAKGKTEQVADLFPQTEQSTMQTLAPTNPKDRFEVYRFFNGLSLEAKEGLDSRRLRAPLVKTFLLEHVDCRTPHRQKTPQEIFRGLDAEVRLLDDTFMSLTFVERDPEKPRETRVTTGYLEQYDDRFFAYYTCEKTEVARKRFNCWIQSPELDATWFSSPLLQRLWDKNISQSGDFRFSKLTFKHESIFDMPSDFSTPEYEIGEETDEDHLEQVSRRTGDPLEFERRKARFQMGDRIGRIRGALADLQRIYAPLYVLHAIRFPSTGGRGGHELSQMGQITNRSESFEEHRNLVRYLYRVYSAILRATEKNAWPSTDKEKGLPQGLKGVPLIIKFKEPLPETTFNRWIQMAFQKRNRFKLWGNPIRLGPTKVHVYGADRHLWQPINLELTQDQLVAILPQGTCGNTFHRLVTNIQQYVSPEIEAWVGAQRFEDLVNSWPSDQELRGED